MGVSTDGIICVGYDLGEEVEFPWRDGDGDDDQPSDLPRWVDDEESWWDWHTGYRPSSYPFGDDGNWLPGLTEKSDRDAAYKLYATERDAWRESHPKKPFELVHHCSGECTMYILAIPGTVITAARGYPKEIPAYWGAPTSEAVEALQKVAETLGLDRDGFPKRLLCSMWW